MNNTMVREIRGGGNYASKYGTTICKSTIIYTVKTRNFVVRPISDECYPENALK